MDSGLAPCGAPRNDGGEIGVTRPGPALAMPDSSWLWVVFTIIAAAAQTVRNATQRGLTAQLGTVGATHVRFLFGFPFALAFLAAVLIATGAALPRPPLAF